MRPRVQGARGGGVQQAGVPQQRPREAHDGKRVLSKRRFQGVV